MVRYWIWWNDLTQGPFELDELVTLKAFSEDLLVCMEDREDWIPASRVADLSSAIEQLRTRKAAPLSPPPPPPKRPPTLTPLQGEFFTEAQEQGTLLDPEDGPQGPFAYRPVSIESESSVSYLVGQVTMPFHFMRQPMSPVGGTSVIEMPVSAPARVMFAPQPVIRESPIRRQEEEPTRVPLRVLREESSIDWSEPAPSQAPSFEEPAAPVRKLEWVPWILGVLASLLILGTAGYWTMDRASTRSAIAEANRLELPKRLSLSGSIPQASSPAPAESAVRQNHAVHPKSFFARAVSGLLRRLGFSPSHKSSRRHAAVTPVDAGSSAAMTTAPATQVESSEVSGQPTESSSSFAPHSNGGAATTSATAASSSRAGSSGVQAGAAQPSSEAASANSSASEVSGQDNESRSSESPSTNVGKGSESFLTRTFAKVLAPAGFVPASSVASAVGMGSSRVQSGVTQTSDQEVVAPRSSGAKAVAARIVTAILAHMGFVPAPSAASVSSTSGMVSYAQSGASSHHAGSSVTHPLRKTNKTTVNKKPNSRIRKGQTPLSSKAVALIANGNEAAAQSALTGQTSAGSEAANSAETSAAAVPTPAVPAASVVPGVPSKALPGLGGAHSNDVADPKAIPVQDTPVPLAPESTDPWRGKQNEAIALVTNKKLPKTKITVGSQAKSMLQEMHEKELIHAAETGVRLYLPDKIAWAALQEDGPHYRVYLNFMASQANGERVQTRSYQFLVDLQRHEVRPADAVTQQDLLNQPAELTFKHNPMATDIDSILGGVDTFNKHKVQLIIVKNSRSNRDERKKMENAMNIAQAKIKRGVVYFRRTYAETALQNIAKAYNFTELLQ